MGNQHARLKESAKQYIQQRNTKIRQFIPILERTINQSGINNDQIRQISSKNASQLVQMLNNSQITSRQLVKIFTYRCITIGKLLNLITEVNYENAMELASKCDGQRKKTGKKNWSFGDQWDMQKYFPPLYGIPTSVKECIDIKGMASTLGLIQRACQIKQKDNQIITCFKTAGLIPIVKSNLAQLCFTFQTNNFLWGRAENIWNRQRTVGGSSGGQGGLLASSCSPIGIGTDIGGSLRIPALFCGVYSLKTSVNRITPCQTFYARGLYGRTNIVSVNGPIGKSADDLALWMKMATCQQFYNGEHDVFNKLHLFDDAKYLKAQKPLKLKIGYFKNLNLIQTTIVSQRAVMEVKTVLQSLGHQFIQIKLPNEDQIIKAFFSQFTAEGKSRLLKDLLGKQEIIPQLTQFLQTPMINPIMFSLIKNMYKLFKPRMGQLLSVMKQLSLYQYFIHGGMINLYKEKVIQYWKQNKLDFIISPGYACQALKHGFASHTFLTAAYTFIWNVLSLPSGALPITVVKHDEQFYQSRYDDIITEVLKQSAKESVGLPVGIQIIGLPFQEQRILGLMKIVEGCVKFSQKYPPPGI